MSSTGRWAAEFCSRCVSDELVSSSRRNASLTLEHEAYKPYKGVKMVTRAGRFQVRTGG